MEAVSIVIIKNKIPLFKKDEQANAIELIELQEVGYEIVAQKDLYSIGDKAVLIQPDYCLPDIPLFESYIRPNGDESKSMLGKVGGLARRIRAKKFTLSKEPNGLPVYSNGILLPLSEVLSYCRSHNFIDLDNLTEMLDITKYEEPDNSNKGPGMAIGQKELTFPAGVYKTDEENINNLWNHIENNLKYPVVLVGTEKVDGSSITIGTNNDYPEGFICSRNIRKKIFVNKIIGRKKKTLIQKLLFWKKFDLNIYEKQLNTDDFVYYGKPYLDKLIEKGYANFVLRGELNGSNLKGSGNKNNPSRSLYPNIQFFGVDIIEEGVIARKVDHNSFKAVTKYLDIPTVKQVFLKSFNSKEEILSTCEEYFKENLIEGIVVRTLDGNFSAKVMNLEYDSKK